MQHSCKRASCVRPTEETCEHPSGCREIRFSIRRQTEDADTIALVVILDEELVSILDMVGEVLCEHLVQNQGSEAKERRNDAGLKVTSRRLPASRSARSIHGSRGRRGTFLVIAELGLWATYPSSE